MVKSFECKMIFDVNIKTQWVQLGLQLSLPRNEFTIDFQLKPKLYAPILHRCHVP
jgi:hypothetical protein